MSENSPTRVHAGHRRTDQPAGYLPELAITGKMKTDNKPVLHRIDTKTDHEEPRDCFS